MNDHNSIKLFLAPIFDKYYPDQKIIMDLYLDDELNELEEGIDILDPLKYYGEFEAGVGVVEIKEFPKLLRSVYLVLKLRDKFDKSKINDLWIEIMIDNGITESIARRIQKDFPLVNQNK